MEQTGIQEKPNVKISCKVSFHEGKKFSRKHNKRDYDGWNQDGHINSDFSKDNLVLVDTSLREFFETEFKEAITEYNQKNQKKHPGRVTTVFEYYEKNRGAARECIIQLGDEQAYRQLVDALGREEANKIHEKFLTEAIKHWKKDNPNLKIFGAYIHFDEKTPHLHLDYLPVAEYSRGMKKKVSRDGALNKYKRGAKYGENKWTQWAVDERKTLESIAENFYKSVQKEQKKAGKDNIEIEVIPHEKFTGTRLTVQEWRELQTITAKKEIVESEVETLQHVAMELREENFALQRKQHKLIPEVEKLRTLAPEADKFAELIELTEHPLPPEPEKPRKKFGESDASYQKRKTAYQDAMKQYREELNKLPVIQKSDHLIERLQQMNWDLDDARNQAMKQIQTEYVEGKILALMRGMNSVALPDGSESVWSYYKKSIGVDGYEDEGELLKALGAASLRYIQEQQRLAEEREMLLREQAQRSRKIQLQDEASQPKREEEMLR